MRETMRETPKLNRAWKKKHPTYQISKLFGLLIKAEKIIFLKKKTKFLSDVSMFTVERVP